MEISNKTNVSDTEATCKIDITPEELETIRKNAIKKVQSKAHLKGFRKGRANEALILKHFAGSVEEEYRSEAINAALRFFHQGQKIIGKPALTNLNLGLDIPTGSVEFSYSPYPDIPDIKVNEIKLERPIMADITDQQIYRFISELLISVSKENHDTASDFGKDILKLKENLEKYQGNEDAGKKNAKSSKVDSNKNVDEYTAGGNELLDAKDVKACLENLSDESIKILFETDRSDIEQVVKNRIRDEFGVYSTNYIKIQLFNILENTLQFSVPNQLIESDVNSLEAIKQQLHTESKVFADKSEKEQEEVIRKYSIRRAKIGIFLSHYAQINSLKLSYSDISKYLEHLRVSDFDSYQYIISDLNNRLSLVNAQVMEDKSIRHIIDHVSFQDINMSFYELINKLEQVEQESLK